MAADHQVEQPRPAEQFLVAVVAHVGDEHQHVHPAPQLFGPADRLGLRIGKLQPGEARGIARRMARPLVVRHRTDESDLHAAAFDDRRSRQLREGAGVAQYVGADDLEIHAVDHPSQKRLPVVEFVVAERGHVVAEPVHQLDDRLARHGGLIDIGVARPAVAGIDQQRIGDRIAARLDGGGQAGEMLDLGVHVVRGQHDDRALAGSAGRSGRDGGEQGQTGPSFHGANPNLSCQSYKLFLPLPCIKRKNHS